MDNFAMVLVVILGLIFTIILRTIYNKMFDVVYFGCQSYIKSILITAFIGFSVAAGIVNLIFPGAFDDENDEPQRGIYNDYSSSYSKDSKLDTNSGFSADGTYTSSSGYSMKLPAGWAEAYDEDFTDYLLDDYGNMIAFILFPSSEEFENADETFYRDNFLTIMGDSVEFMSYQEVEIVGYKSRELKYTVTYETMVAPITHTFIDVGDVVYSFLYFDVDGNKPEIFENAMNSLIIFDISTQQKADSNSSEAKGDYDDYDSDYEFASVDYDLSKVDIMLNGEKVVLAEGIADIATLVDTEGITVIKAGEYDYFYSEDYALTIRVKNETEADLPIENCPVSGIDFGSYYSENTTTELSVNGIKIGSTVKEVATAFNSEISESATSIDIDDIEDYKYFTFSIEDGLVTSISYREY